MELASRRGFALVTASLSSSYGMAQVVLSELKYLETCSDIKFSLQRLAKESILTWHAKLELLRMCTSHLGHELVDLTNGVGLLQRRSLLCE